MARRARGGLLARSRGQRRGARLGTECLSRRHDRENLRFVVAKTDDVPLKTTDTDGMEWPAASTGVAAAVGTRAEGPRADGPRTKGPQAQGPQSVGPRAEGQQAECLPTGRGPRVRRWWLDSGRRRAPRKGRRLRFGSGLFGLWRLGRCVRNDRHARTDRGQRARCGAVIRLAAVGPGRAPARWLSASAMPSPAATGHHTLIIGHQQGPHREGWCLIPTRKNKKQF